MLICPKCKSECRVVYIRKRKDGYTTRNRKCMNPDCDFVERTIEVPREEFDANNYLILKLKDFLQEYMEIKNGRRNTNK